MKNKLIWMETNYFTIKVRISYNNRLTCKCKG